MARKYLLVLALALLCATLICARAGWAYDYGLKILDKDQISQLSDEALANAYVDTLIEIEAAKIFHIKAGFNPKDYQDFKNLIRYRVNLLFELKRRKLEIPQIEANEKGKRDVQINATAGS